MLALVVVWWMITDGWLDGGSAGKETEEDGMGAQAMMRCGVRVCGTYDYEAW